MRRIPTGIAVSLLALTELMWAPLAPAASVYSVTATRCGVARWDVKTLSDASASRVKMTPVPAKVETLRALPVPGPIETHTPRYPQETQTYTVKATLRQASREQDSDYHLVLVGVTPDATMIVEIPDPACVASQDSAVTGAIKKARTYFDQTFGAPAQAPQFTTFQTPPQVTVSGVLFFDAIHGQRGVAPNGVELHPVLDLHSP
jgi:hypothetical protein